MCEPTFSPTQKTANHNSVCFKFRILVSEVNDKTFAPNDCKDSKEFYFILNTIIIY